MKIRILQLGSPQGLYGAERWILALVRHLDTMRIESIVSAIKDESSQKIPLCTEAEKLGFKTKIFESLGRISFSAIKQIRSFIHQEKIHILHTHGYKQDLIGLLATIGTNCRIISTPHGWSRDAGLKLQFYERINRLIFPFFNGVVPLSPELNNRLKHIPFLTNKLTLIRNGVDTVEIEETRKIANELVNLKEQGFFVIGYIGQLIHRKGIDILFKAVSKLERKNRFKVVLVGNGPQQSFLEKLSIELEIESNVFFLGFRNNRLEFLNGFDVFVLPSRLEGIPRCLMETMAAGVPIVCSNIPGSNELIKDNQTGSTFMPEDANDLCEKLNRFMVNPDSHANMTKMAKEKVFIEYSAQRMAKDYEKLFFSL